MADEQYIYLSPEEDLTSVRERLQKIPNRHIVLVVPPASVKAPGQDVAAVRRNGSGQSTPPVRGKEPRQGVPDDMGNVFEEQTPPIKGNRAEQNSPPVRKNTQ